MTSLTGTAALTRLVLRRDRVRIVIWAIAIAGFVLAAASGIKAAYPSPADLEAAAAALRDNTAQIALNGPAQALDTVGGRVAFEVWNIGLVAVALMSLLTVGRHIRAEEESGRSELVRSSVVGRLAPVAAALLMVAGMNLLVGVAVAAGLVGQGLQAQGALTLGAALGGVGLVFAGVATVAGQVTQSSRVASGMAGSVLALGFGLRAIGDVSGNGLSWLSPLAWAQASRPFADERWWPLLLSAGFAVALAFVSAAIAAHRDVGAGLAPPRRGPAAASAAIGRPIGFAFRLQRASLVAWVVGVLAGGIAFGTVADGVGEFVGDGEGFRDVFAQGPGRLTDAFLATALLMLALLATGFALQSAQRLGAEEDAGRAEPLLAAAMKRSRWAGSHLVVALAGSAVVLAAAGTGVGLGFGIASENSPEVMRLVGAALAYTPAVWVLVGFTVAVFGLAPRALPAAWAALAWSLVVGLFGHLLDLPEWLRDTSPFHHVPRMPVEDLAAVPLVALAAIAAGLAAVGLAGFRRRDIR